MGSVMGVVMGAMMGAVMGAMMGTEDTGACSKGEIILMLYNEVNFRAHNFH